MEYQRQDIDKIHSYVKDAFESKYPFFINGREKAEIKKLKTFINYSHTINMYLKGKLFSKD